MSCTIIKSAMKSAGSGIQLILMFVVINLVVCQKIGNSSEAEAEDYDEWDLSKKGDVNKIIEFYDWERFSGDKFIDGITEQYRKTLGPIDTVVIVIYSIITVIGLLANAVVFFVIFAGNETGKTVTAIYVLQLTLADTVFLFTLPVFSVQKVSHNWSFGAGICKLCQTIKFMNYYAGVFFLMAMSVDRYIAVAYSTRLTRLRTKRRTYVVCLCMWMAAGIMSLPLILYANTETALGVTHCRVMFPGYVAHDPEDSYFEVFEIGYYETDTDTTLTNNTYSGNYAGTEYSYTDLPEGDKKYSTCSHDTHSFAYKSWLIVDFVFGFIVPFTVIVISYCLILTHLKTSEQKIGHTATNRAVKMRKRVTRMVAALVMCFAMCWLPHHLFQLTKIEGVDLSVLVCHGFENFLVALAFSNSAINPILYTFMGNNFRERLRKSVDNTHKRLRKNSRQSSLQKQSSNTHSDPANSRKMSGLTYNRGRKISSLTENGPRNYRKASKLSQLALLGPRKQSVIFPNEPVQTGAEHRAADFIGTTTIGEQTMETKI